MTREDVKTDPLPPPGRNPFAGYTLGRAYDEMFDRELRPRPHYRGLLPPPARPSAGGEFRRRKAMTDLSMLQDGVGFTVYRQEEGIERVWPMDPVPRIIPADEWDHIETRAGAAAHGAEPVPARTSTTISSSSATGSSTRG